MSSGSRALTHGGCNSCPTTNGPPRQGPAGPCIREAHTVRKQVRRHATVHRKGWTLWKPVPLRPWRIMRCCAVGCCTCNREMLRPSDQEMDTSCLKWHDLCLAWHAKLPEPRQMRNWLVVVPRNPAFLGTTPPIVTQAHPVPS
jgi:hypothetical protein